MGLTISQLLQFLVQNDGSDLHIGAGAFPAVRIRGELVRVPNTSPLAVLEIGDMITELTTPAQREELVKELSIDFAYRANGIGIFRVNVLQQKAGPAVVMRVLSESPPTIEKLNLPEMCRKACHYPNGLVLVTGPTGSGKSTTLAAMLNDINMRLHGHILTLEDPIEFQHESKMCAISQRSFGADFTTFGSAMRAAFREDPDVILVGEMRDPETIALAIKAAETGRLVFSTLHTNSASKTVDRMINVFPADEQPQIRSVLSETLRVIISQRLVPSADKSRRYCIHDILVNTKAVANLIREGKTFQIPSLMLTGKDDGMQIGDKVMLEYVEAGKIKGEVAWEYASDKSNFAKWAPKDHVEPAAAPAPANGAPPVILEKKAA
jgi:twitching motility protein PilT